MATYNGSVMNSAWKSQIVVTTTSDDSNYYITVVNNMVVSSSAKTDRKFVSTISCTGQTSASGTLAAKTRSSGTYKVASTTFTVARGSSDATVTVSGKLVGSASGKTTTTSTATGTVTVSKHIVTVTYNGNGGKDAPGPQTFTYNVAGTLTTGYPTYSGYDFLGWSTSSTATSATYSVGQSNVTFTADTTLYAVWHVAYSAPSISNLEAFRIEASGDPGSTPTMNAEATNAFCRFKVTNPPTGSYTAMTITATMGDSAFTLASDSTYRYGYGLTIATNVSSSVVVTVNVTDYKGSTHPYNYTTSIASVNYLWDAYRDHTTGYQSFGIGCSAWDLTTSGRTAVATNPAGDLVVGMKAHFQGGLDGVVSNQVEGQDGSHTIGLSWTGSDFLLQVDTQIKRLLDYTHPVGSTMVMSTNTNPNTLPGYGGTSWTLTNKQFATAWNSYNVSGGVFTASNVSAATIYVSHAGEMITLTCEMTLSAALTDDTKTLGKFVPSALGIGDFNAGHRMVAWSDGGNGFAMLTLANDGTLNCSDAMSGTTHSIASGQTIQWSLAFTDDTKVDSFCDKFFWKRTA